MTVIKRVVAFAILSLAVVPFAAAAATTGGKTSSKTCEDDEFYYDVKDCCLPEGGPTATTSVHSSATPTVHSTVSITTSLHATTTYPVVHTTVTSTHTSATAVSTAPPKGKSCPPTKWYWHDGLSCCVPKHSPPPNSPPPQCSNGNTWEDATQCCIPSSPSKPTSTSKPSSTPGHYGYGKRQHTSRDVPACPRGLDACPISGLTSGDYECLDISAELESCGGCTSVGQGQDCTAIKGAWNVGCDRGSCKVYSCFAGFRLSVDGTSCVPL